MAGSAGWTLDAWVEEESMGWVDPEHREALRRDWRYDRLFKLDERCREAREAGMPACTNCQGGQTTMRDADGNEVKVTCLACGGSGEVGSPVDNEDNGQASGGR